MPSAPAPATLEPSAVSAAGAARFSGISEPSWHRHNAAGKVPAPIKIGGRVLWLVEELRAWLKAGAPDRQTWEAMKASQAGR